VIPEAWNPDRRGHEIAGTSLLSAATGSKAGLATKGRSMPEEATTPSPALGRLAILGYALTTLLTIPVWEYGLVNWARGFLLYHDVLSLSSDLLLWLAPLPIMLGLYYLIWRVSGRGGWLLWLCVAVSFVLTILSFPIACVNFACR
jgi:hypothetical protein